MRVYIRRLSVDIFIVITDIILYYSRRCCIYAMYTVVEIELSTYVHVQVLHGLANTCSASHKPPPLHGRDEG